MNKLIFISVAFLFTTYFYVYSQTNNVNTLDNLYPKETTVVKYHNNWTQIHYKQRINGFKNSPLAMNGIVFIGNSITEQGKNWNEKFGTDNIFNRGIAGDITEGVLNRLEEIIYYKPKAIFILIGINDLFNIHYQDDNRHNLIYYDIIPSVDYIGQNIIKITRMLHLKLPDTKIYVRTILPTDRPYLKDDIVQINKMLKDNESNESYEIIDLFTLFVNKEGFIKKELTKDGVHLNEEGYKIWVDYEKHYVLD